MLEDIRVLDLSDENGILAGYLLAHLGAEVIAVEPPGGSHARRVAPFNSTSGDGLWWEAYARGKQSIELDLSSDAGIEAFNTLVREADILIESATSNQRRQFGLAYEEIARINPTTICVAITPFGLDGPKADWPATDLTVWAASGTHILAGDDDRAPVRTSVPQAFLHAGADAAGAALIALQARHKTGKGQQVDVSAQQSSAQAALAAHLTHQNNSDITVARIAGGLAAAMPIRMTWPCADGYVAITLLFGPAFTEPNRRLLKWVHETGHCGAEDVETDWGARIMAMSLGEDSPEAYHVLCQKVENFTLERTQSELFEEGLDRGIYIAPTLSIEGLLQERHFRARDFWQETTSGDKTIDVPGPFAKLSESPLTQPGPAPGIGDHSGFSGKPGLSDAGSDISKPLEGLKVLDFMWVIAGPFCTRVLADYGATVIKVESTTRFEPARTSPPFKDGEKTPEHGIPFADFNTGKLGVTINPNNPMGKEVLLDLVRWADVVTESFSPKAMKSWGLDYDSLREVNPDIIMLSSCLMGQTGPRAMVPGYGNMAAAVTGFYELTGWADRSPAGPYLAYTDGVSPRYMLVSLLAALEHKRKTGKGQHIDVSQAEAAIHMLAPAIHDYEVNGHIWGRMDNRDLTMCPHGVYPTKGTDQWIALACQTNADWEKLAELMDESAPEHSATAEERKLIESELDDSISRWTQSQEGATLQNLLVENGIAAHVLQDSTSCTTDPQYVHRGHFVEVDQTIAGKMVVEGSRFKLRDTPAVIERGPPATGEHNIEILMDILGYDEDRVADVLASLCME